MSSYESWLESIAAEKEYERVCRECDCMVNIAKITGENVSQVIAEAEQRKLQAKLNMDLKSRY